MESRLKAAEATAKQAESTAKEAQSVVEKVEVKEKKAALDEAVAELEAEEGQRAAGFRLNGLLPVPWFSELSFGSQDPTSSTMVSFQGSGHGHGDEGEEEHEHEEEEHLTGDGLGGFVRVRTDDSELDELVYLLRWVNGWDMGRNTSARPISFYQHRNGPW